MASMRRALASAVLLAAAVCVSPVRADAPASARPAVPFIEDDYARALKEARAKNVPIFVENWAPW
jgi:hypothetical protein